MVGPFISVQRSVFPDESRPLACMHAKSLQLLSDSVQPHGLACEATVCLGSSVHGILQARIPEWVVIPSSRGFSRPRGQTCISYISYIGRHVLYH